jgi:hypothetical protein
MNQVEDGRAAAEARPGVIPEDFADREVEPLPPTVGDPLSVPRGNARCNRRRISR